MDKVFELKSFNYSAQNPDALSSQQIILSAISDLTNISKDAIIDRIEMKCSKILEIKNNGTTIPIDTPVSHIIMNKNTMECISVDGKSPNGIINFNMFLNTIELIDPLMTKCMYDIWRKQFTSLYYDAFFNEEQKSWSFDTDEINDILDYKCYRVRVKSKKINDVFYWRLVDSNLGQPSDESWDELLHEYAVEELKKDQLEGIKLELTQFLDVFKGAYPIMDQPTYSLFSKGFKAIYNKHVAEHDKYEKVNISIINNILKMFRLPYIVQKDHGKVFITKCEN